MMEGFMTILVHADRYAARRAGGIAVLRSAFRLATLVLGWPSRVLANRRVLDQMAGMGVHELADIGLTPADLQDTAALPLDAEVGRFLASRVAARRFARDSRA
jgi:uncharacterized protein YjiS (DUF1127 family)